MPVPPPYRPEYCPGDPWKSIECIYAYDRMGWIAGWIERYSDDPGERMLIEVRRKCRPASQRLASTVAMSLLVTDVLASTVNTPVVADSLVVCTTTGMSLCFNHETTSKRAACRINFDKYHPGYFGKVGMRRFHLTRNAQWRPIINVDKLWTLVPEEEKEGLTEDSEVVPVIDILRHGYGKVLGNGK